MCRKLDLLNAHATQKCGHYRIVLCPLGLNICILSELRPGLIYEF